MEFPNKNLFGNAAFGSPNPPEQSSPFGLSTSTSSAFPAAPVPSLFGSFGSPPTVSQSSGSRFGKTFGGFPSSASMASSSSKSSPALTNTNAAFGVFGSNSAQSVGSIQPLFGASSGSNVSSSGLFGSSVTNSGGFFGYQFSSVGNTSSAGLTLGASGFGSSASGLVSSASGFGSSVSGVGSPVPIFGSSASGVGSSGPGFGLPASGVGSSAPGFGLSTSGIGSSAPFGKPVKNLFGKDVSSPAEFDRNEDSQENSGGRAKPPDLMSLSPMKGGTGGTGVLFGKAIAKAKASSDEAHRPERRVVRDESSKDCQPTSSRRVFKTTEDAHSSHVNEGKDHRAADTHGIDHAHKDNRGDNDTRRGPGLRRRRVSSDVDMRVLIVRNIPPNFNNQIRLKSHFSVFGDITRISVHPKTNSAIVYFRSHEAAEKAKEDGCYLSGADTPLQMFWRLTPKQRSPSHSSVREDEPVRMGATTAYDDDEYNGDNKGVSPSRKRRNVVRSEVDEELASMRGTEDIESDNVPRLLERPAATGGELSRQEGSRHAQQRMRTPPPPAYSVVARPSGPSASVVPAKTDEAEPVPQIPGAATLKSLAGSVGQTAGERFAILDNRDKLLRAALGNQKQADLATAKAIRGTCQDMCPEKERYMREDRRRLSFYEIIPGSDQTSKLPPVDHARAVKEYSRSSADQDMPLPQEMRPPEVLDVTMNYLLTYIIETGGPGKWAEWYDFLWNRTRSIRKDITQQHLCDPVAVGLVEKCTRFHIFCSEALCEEDAAVFDEKINNENLTKCLQTLKEMYHDLNARQNSVGLVNEGEFVMYMVLMNLNQGDILREVQQLNATVRESPYVSFSVEVYSALNSTNYVRFFKLVRRAPFLGACILHRYFNQIRTSALQRMIKAYAQPGHGTVFPVSEMLHQMGFESEDHVANFARHHGLSVENGQVLLDKSRFYDSEAFPICRSQTLVERKQSKGLGEVINGGPLPPCVVKEPSSSFDENGHFKYSDVSPVTNVRSTGNESILGSVLTPLLSTSGNLPPQEASPTQLFVPVEVVKDCARELILEVIHETCKEVGRSAVNNAQLLLKCCEFLCEDVVAAAVGELMRDITTECLREQEELETRQRLSLLAASEKIAAEIFEDVVALEMKSAAFEEHKALTELTQNRATEAATDFLVEQLIQQICWSDCEQICHDVFESDVTRRLETLRDCQRTFERLQLGRVFRKWKAQFSAHQRQRKLMETFPPAPSFDSWPDRFSVLVPGSQGIVENNLHLGGTASITLKPPHEIFVERVQLSNEISYSKAVARWQHAVTWLPFDLARMIVDLQLPRKFTPTVKGSSLGSKFYWKLAVAFPHPDDRMEDDRKTYTWIKAKLSKGKASASDRGDDDQAVVLSRYSSPLNDVESVSAFSSVNVCVVSVTCDDEQSSMSEKNHLLGSSGILFVMTQDIPETPEFWKQERARLSLLLSAKPPLPKIPVAVVCASDVEHVTDKLNLIGLKVSNQISDFKVFSLSADLENPQTSDELENAVMWLMRCCPKPLQIIGTGLRDFVEDGLSWKYFTPVLENLKLRREKGLLHLVPNKLINIYNGVIWWVSRNASNLKLMELSWPVTEFVVDHSDLPETSWNAAYQLQHLGEVICRLVLPEFVPQNVEGGTWKKACADVWNYMYKITDRDENRTRLLNKVGLLLSKAEHQFRMHCRPSPWSSLHKCPLPLYANFPWTDFIMICIEYKLDCALSSTSETEDLKVYYLPELLEPYNDVSISLEVELEKSAAGEIKLQDTVISAKKRKTLLAIDEPSIRMPKKFSMTLCADNSENAEILDKQKNSVDHLMDMMQKEKKCSLEFEEFLKKTLEMGALPAAQIGTQTFSDSENSLYSDHYFVAPIRRDRDSLPRNVPTFPDLTPIRGEFQSRRQSDSQLPTKKLCEQVQDLNNSLKSERTANMLFEIRLENALLNDFK